MFGKVNNTEEQLSVSLNKFVFVTKLFLVKCY